MLKISLDDGMRRFQNIKRRHYVNDFSEVIDLVIPNLFRDLGFDPLGGRWTVDGQCGFHQRPAVL